MAWTKGWFGAIASALKPHPYLFALLAATTAAFDLARPLAKRNFNLDLLPEVPSPLLAIVVILLLFVILLVNRLAAITAQISLARVSIAKLRVEGVALRNQGLSIKTDDAWTDWEKAVLAWEQNVIAALKQISEAHAEWFGTLDIVPPSRIPITDHYLGNAGAHQTLFWEHDFRVRRLGEMIYSLWRTQ